MKLNLFFQSARTLRIDALALQAAMCALPAFMLTGAVLLTGCESPRVATVPATQSANSLAPVLQPAPQVPAANSAPAPSSSQRRVQQLISQVEEALLSGQSHYRKGQLLRAKADFDNAVDLMLAGGPNHDLDVKADPQLQDEFNRVVDAINALEMEALKRGNGFAPAVEPSPSDVANDVTFEVDPNLVATAKAQLATTKSDLPLVINDYVAAFINFFANTQRGHNTLMHSFQRAGRYKQMIQRVLTEEGVPQDLIYLAVAESSFQPQAVNGRSGAGGMWQFMPHGDYGLTRNGYVDERFDPEKSTRAYARYMKFNYNQLGDWYLAMAGYNWGAGNVQRAVQKTGYADFWELYKRNNLPGETKNYVPEILAAIIIANNPKQYGFESIQLDSAIVSDTVPIDYAVDLRLAADVVDAQPQELLTLNPSLLRLTTPPPSTLVNGSFDLHLPPGTATLFKQRIAEIPEDRRTHWRYHRVTPEDSLSAIARSYHVSVEQLAAANQLHADDTLDKVEALVVPVPLPSAPASHVEYYKPRRGDTLVTIADRFGVSLDDLRRWNHSAVVIAGQRIRVTEPARVAPRTRDHAEKKSSLTTHHNRQTSSESKKKSSTKNKTPAAESNKSKSPTHGEHAARSTAAGNPKKTQPHHSTELLKNIQK